MTLACNGPIHVPLAGAVPRTPVDALDRYRPPYVLVANKRACRDCPVTWHSFESCGHPAGAEIHPASEGRNNPVISTVLAA